MTKIIWKVFINDLRFYERNSNNQTFLMSGFHLNQTCKTVFREKF